MKEIDKSLPKYTKGEEIFNAVSHIVGGAFGIFVLIFSLIAAVNKNIGATGILSVIMYGVSMILLYTMSSIYHFLRPNTAKKVFRIFDHCTIYLLIAGTYSPICLIALKDDVVGTILFIIVWICAILGIIANAIGMHRKIIKVLSMFLYIAMGWCVVFAIVPLLKVLPLPGFLWLLAGGVSYTVGAVFYGFGKKAKYIHSVWHLFVLLGSILHFIAIYLYII